MSVRPSEAEKGPFRFKRPPGDLQISKVYVEFHADSDFEGPRAVRGHFKMVFDIVLVFVGSPLDLENSLK